VTSLIGGDTISWHLDSLLCRSIDFQSAAVLFSVWLRILGPERVNGGENPGQRSGVKAGQ